MTNRKIQMILAIITFCLFVLPSAAPGEELQTLSEMLRAEIIRNNDKLSSEGRIGKIDLTDRTVLVAGVAAAMMAETTRTSVCKNIEISNKYGPLTPDQMLFFYNLWGHWNHLAELQDAVTAKAQSFIADDTVIGGQRARDFYCAYGNHMRLQIQSTYWVAQQLKQKQKPQ